jgi:hypothetical protein
MSTRPNDEGFAFHIHQFMPDCQGEELEQRIALLKARGYSCTLMGSTVSELARGHAIDARNAADHFVYCPASTPVSLNRAVLYCRHLVQCAFLAEHLDPEVWG